MAFSAPSYGVWGDKTEASGYPTLLWFRDGQLQVSAPAATPPLTGLPLMPLQMCVRI
jgi:hypothetical protein